MPIRAEEHSVAATDSDASACPRDEQRGEAAATGFRSDEANATRFRSGEANATRFRSDQDLRHGSVEAVALDRVSRRFLTRDGATVEALSDLSLRAHPHSVLAVVGPSGCGKSTLLELLCGLQAPDEGSVQAPPAALMPQRDLLLPWLSAIDNAALPLRLAGASRRQAKQRARPLFAELGLAGFEHARPAQLSGGMRQRIAFLRTLLSGKSLLCLDEPFGALDAITRLQMQAWLSDALERQPRTVVLVTHDVEEAVLLADSVAVLSPRPGRLVRRIEVDLPRPRSRTDEAVLSLREQALHALGIEAKR